MTSLFIILTSLYIILLCASMRLHVCFMHRNAYLYYFEKVADEGVSALTTTCNTLISIIRRILLAMFARVINDRRGAVVLLIASLLLARTQARWTGPVVRLRPSPSGISASLTVSGKDVAPMWIGGCTGIPCAGSGSSETRWANWNFTVTQAARVGLPLVEVELPPYLWQQVPIAAAVDAVITKTLEHNPAAYIVLRVYFASKPQTAFENITVQYANGTVADPCPAGGGPGCPANAALSADWIAATARKLEAMLAAMDKLHPGKIAAVRLGHMAGEEWVLPHPDLPGPIGAADYSETTRKGFCGNVSSCALPSFAERSSPNFGNAFRAGNSPSMHFERYLARAVADAIIGLARAAKRVSGGNLAVWTYYGYVLAFAEYGLLGRSGHASALRRVLQEPAVDGLSDAYMYSRACRDVRGTVLPDTVVDSLRVAGKVFILEDDTRTSLNTIAHQRGMQCCHTTAQDVQTFRRNQLSLALRGSATYLLANCLGGWWGRADVPASVTTQYWDTFVQIQATIRLLQSNHAAGRSARISRATRPQVHLSPYTFTPHPTSYTLLHYPTPSPYTLTGGRLCGRAGAAATNHARRPGRLDARERPHAPKLSHQAPVLRAGAAGRPGTVPPALRFAAALV